MNSMTRVEMLNALIEVAAKERFAIQRRFVARKLVALHPQEDVDAILADFITQFSHHIEIPHTVIAEDFLPKVRDDGGPL